VLALHPHRSGFFLRRKVAEDMLRRTPPQNILRELGYSTVDEMLAREDLFEIFAALRFLEDREWMNTKFVHEYNNLKVTDFEVRPIEVRVLQADKWQKVTEAFIKKKKHPMSHLKELGLIFVIPSPEMKEILTIYLFGMVSHYLDEVGLYSNYFRYHSKSDNFGTKVVSAIRGDVPDVSLSKGDPYKWLIVQRYLFKENKDDPRLFAPHINPEALYHRGASRALLHYTELIPALDFDIWQHTNYVAVWFPTKDGEQVLVNFNLMDNIMTVMSNLAFKERYSYHFQESLWNKIFINFFGVEKMEETIIKNLLAGAFDIRKL
jgi:hypothetical protein